MNIHTPVAEFHELARIPALVDLMNRRQWIVWRYVQINGKWTKPPHSPKLGNQCSATDPANWTDYQTARNWCLANPGYGVGFALSPDDGLSGIDLDKCRDATLGLLMPWASEIIGLAETYAEVSPSGTGIRMLVDGKVAKALKYDPAGVEVYGQDRYLTITGRHINSTPTAIGKAPLTLGALEQRVALFRKARAGEAKPDAKDDARKAESRSSGFWRAVNDTAMVDLDRWVPKLFPRATRAAGGWRVSSADLGRDLEEDLSIHRDGITDFGVHDVGDPRNGKRTPIGLVLEWGDVHALSEGMRWKKAAFLMCEWLGVSPQSLGWTDEPPKEEGKPEPEPAAPDNAFDPWAKYPVPAFPFECLPLHVRDFTLAAHEQTGGCRSAIAMAALATVSGALDHGWRLRMHRNTGWAVAPNLWVLLVGDPSTKKTPLLNAALHPLEAQEADSRRAYKSAVAAWKAAGENDDSEPPPPTRYVATDVTVEKLGEILAGQTRGILIKRDEMMGWIASMERYGSSGAGSADRPFWLQAYDCGSYSIDRIRRGSLFIENLSATIVGGIQPARLREVAGLTSDGLLQRFIPVMVGSPAFPQDRHYGTAATDWKLLIAELVSLQPGVLAMDSAAAEAAETFRRTLHEIEQAVTGMAAGFDAFVGKLPAVFGKLCLLLHLAGGGLYNAGRPVDDGTVARAARIVETFLLPHALEFYRTAESVTDGDRLQTVASYILTSGKTRFVVSDFTRNVASMRGIAFADAVARLSPLVAGGWLMPDDIRFPRAFELTPGVRERFEERARQEEARKARVADLMGSPRKRRAA